MIDGSRFTGRQLHETPSGTIAEMHAISDPDEPPIVRCPKRGCGFSTPTFPANMILDLGTHELWANPES